MVNTWYVAVVSLLLVYTVSVIGIDSARLAGG